MGDRKRVEEEYDKYLKLTNNNVAGRLNGERRPKTPTSHPHARRIYVTP